MASNFSWPWKLKWIAITPKPFSALSVILGTCIIKHIALDRKRRSSVYHRLILVLSIFSVLGSTATFTGTWFIPSGTPGVYLASGNDLTCSIQGFFIQMFGTGTGLYYSSLSIYYFLTIILGWNENKVKNVERWLHAVPFLFSLITAIIGASLDLYNNAQVWCWIAPPANHVSAYRLAFFYVPCLVGMFLATVIMIIIIRHVLLQERATDKYNIRAPNGQGMSNRRKNTKTVAKQAVAYVIAFYLTLLFPLIVRMSQMVNGTVNFVWVALFSIFMPGQGIYPFVVYFRPLYLRYRRRHPQLSTAQVVISFLRNALSPVSFVSKSFKMSSSSSRIKKSSRRNISHEVSAENIQTRDDTFNDEEISENV